jgi:amino acid transporter
MVVQPEPRSDPSRPATTRLVRAVGLLGLIAISLNGVIGSGIFVLPKTVYGLLGPASPIAYLTAAALTTLVVLCFAEAGSMFERTGGPYVYTREAFGSFVGFEVGWMFLITRLVASAAITAAFTSYLGYFWPALASGPGRLAAVTISIAGLAAINIAGVRYGSWTVNFMTVAKLIPLLLFIVAGLFAIDPEALRLSVPFENLSLRRASLVLIFAYGGFENASVPTEEVHNPTHNLPRALLVSITSATLIYVLIQIVAQGTLPGLASDPTPLASAARNFLGESGALVIVVAAIISTLGSNSAVALVGPRILFAFGEGGQLPRVLARINPRFQTPAVSIVAFALMQWVLALYGDFARLVAVSAMARLFFSAATCIAIPVLRRKMPEQRRDFRLKGGALIPVLAASLSIWLLTGISRTEAIAGLAALSAGGLLFLIVRKGQA